MHPIARYRRAKGLTQTELAQQVGVALNTVQSWERGAKPRPRYQVKLAEALSMGSLQLLDEIEQWKAKGKTDAA